MQKVKTRPATECRPGYQLFNPDRFYATFLLLLQATTAIPIARNPGSVDHIIVVISLSVSVALTFTFPSIYGCGVTVNTP